jgi:hypothetical protein
MENVKERISRMKVGLISRCAFESLKTTATATATKTTLHHFDHRVDTGISQPVISAIFIMHYKTQGSAFSQIEHSFKFGTRMLLLSVISLLINHTFHIRFHHLEPYNYR